ncbi:MAG TPA: 3-hydroxyacyl-CoA dehydrogenase NAD-binding domain-containing protein [Bacteroidia bacterium]|nr:3-hydroxyacyl-CoA dehydrogenase NAD-binding domain-containing protein [Bacteroidia bacterium]
MTINKVAVIGAGTMGAGIAQVCAQSGLQTVLHDINADMVEKARKGIIKNLDGAVERGKMTAEQKDQTLANLVFTPDFDQLKADLIIEAIIERLDVKVQLFDKLAGINGSETILATNTSTIPITQIAAKIVNPERVVGIHFFNPAHIMKLVEVIAGAQTSDAVLEASKQFVSKVGKTPIVAKDAPGFIVNRVARHFYVEGLKLAEENVASFETIDALCEASGFKMGPFRLMDLIGVDTNFSVTSSMYQLFHYDPKFRPSRIQQQKVDAGHHGRKTSKGFYNY